MPESAELPTRLAEAEAQLEAQRGQIAQLQAQIDLFQRAIDTLPITIFWKDRSSTFLGCNAALAQMAGLSGTADVIGKTDQDMPWAGAEADAFQADDREVMKNDRPKLQIIEPITDAEGTTSWLETSKLPLHDDSGAVIGVIAAHQDVTERRREEERRAAAQQAVIDALRASEAQLRSITEALPVALAVIDTRGVFRVSTGKALERLGVRPGQLVGASAFDLYQHAPDVIDDIRRALAGESFTMRRNIASQAFETIHTPVRNERGEVESVIMVSTDVTERIRAEQESRQLQEQVIAAQQAALRELSTPLIPVAEDVVVMPLIGSIDSARAHLVIESLLEGVERLRAKTAILDITGVPVVDTQVANALLRAAQAARLLGASVVLTGIRPEVAQTLVGLGADLSGISTRGTLQVAITEALTTTGRGR